MKSKLTIVILAIMLFGCNKKDKVNVVSVENSIQVTVDDHSYQLLNENVSSNENCNSIYVSSSYRVNNSTKFYLNFELLKNGQVVNVSYYEFDLNRSSVARNFFTPHYNPVSKMSIKRFIYKPSENYLFFEFDGTIYEEDKISNLRQIAGTVEVNKVKKVSCSVPDVKIEYLSNELLFNQTHYLISTNQTSTNQIHKFLSNNGFRLNLKTSNDLWNLPLSTITFSETSLNNKIELEQYIGPLTSGHMSNNNTQNWKIYETKGSYTIEQKVTYNGYKIIKGKINLQVLYQGNLIYNLNNINYSTRSFVN